MQIGADVIVDGATFGIFDIELPNGVEVAVAVLKTWAEDAQDQPTILPDVGPPVTGTVAWTGGIGLRVHPQPGASTPWSAILPEGAQVVITCQTAGEEVDGPYGVDTWWDRISYNGQTGYASDAYIATGTNDQVAATC